MSELSAERTRLAQLWEEHMRHEFQTCSTEDTLATMVEDSYVNHVPVMTGGVGHAELRQFGFWNDFNRDHNIFSRKRGAA